MRDMKFVLSPVLSRTLKLCSLGGNNVNNSGWGEKEGVVAYSTPLIPLGMHSGGCGYKYN
jgi:hypothetical protein